MRSPAITRTEATSHAATANTREIFSRAEYRCSGPAVELDLWLLDDLTMIVPFTKEYPQSQVSLDGGFSR
jgi:hypothetical protein